MKRKQSRVIAQLACVFGSILSLYVSSCSLDSSAFVEPKQPERTFVRANQGRPTAPLNSTLRLPKAPKTIADLPRWPRPAPVKLDGTADFRRYAVAYGSPYAVVSEQSIIPIAFKSRRYPEKTYAIRKSVETPHKLFARQSAQPDHPQMLRVRTTAYTHNEWDHLKYGRRTAAGGRLQYGAVRSAAADWSRFPVGTTFRIAGEPGVVYQVDDYGGALVGTNTIDIYKPTFASMNRWGVRHVEIEIINWGSYEQSRKILNPRTRWSHVRRMLNAIEANGNQPAAQLATAILH